LLDNRSRAWVAAAMLDREMDQMDEDFLDAFPPEERKLLRNLLTILAGWKQAPRTTAAR
jgi:hypothetical protein